VELIAVRPQVAQGERTFEGVPDESLRRTAALGGEPAYRGVVVVRPSIGNAVVDIAVRQMKLRTGIASEGELQDAHPRQLESVPQRLVFWGDPAQVYGVHGEPAEPLAQRLEERRPRPQRLPPARGGSGVGRYFPVGLEPPEMVETHQIDALGRRLQPGDPP